MAEVWKAFDTQLHRYVAIKLLHADLQTDPEFITRFSREARVIAALHHPNIVQIHDFQATSSPEVNVPVAYMVMDYVEGQTLARYIQGTSRAGKFPPPTDILRLFTSLSKAVDYAHQQGMIHRDIKPANILLDKRNLAHNSIGEPVLTDFGIAKITGISSGTVSGMWLGTPLYISPEQARGHPGTERSDIYSLGIILYEICTGVYPFRGESVPAIMAQQISLMPTPPALVNPAIPPLLTIAILRAMEKDPADRFSSASALAAAIAEAFNLPIPADLFIPVRPSIDMAEPTDLSPHRMGPLPYVVPQGVQWSQPPPVVASTPQTPPPIATTRLFTVPPDSGAGSPVRPAGSTPAPLSPAPQNAQFGAQSYVPPTRRPWGDWKRLFIILFVILFLLAGSTIFALYAFSGGRTGGHISTPAIGGDVIFLNSGQLNAQNSRGVDDEVQIDLHNVPDPASGKSYYAWLKNALINAEGTWVLLGTLRGHQGNAQLPSSYQDPQHADLLVNASSFLVTEEDSSIPPTQPSTDQSVWRFYSEPPLLTLTHLRHLLADSPELQIRQLYGGLGIWFWRNTEKVVEWASSARDDSQSNPPDTDQIHRQLIRILDYIDGARSISMDVPPNTPLLISAHDAQVALVGPQITMEPPGSLYNSKGQVPPGYVYLIRVHLDAAVAAPQATAGQRQLANQIESALNQVTFDLDKVRQDASQMVGLNGTQLETPQSQFLLNDLVAAAQSAYAGPINPAQPQGGASGIYSNIQRMATFQVQPYTAR